MSDSNDRSADERAAPAAAPDCDPAEVFPVRTIRRPLAVRLRIVVLIAVAAAVLAYVIDWGSLGFAIHHMWLPYASSESHLEDVRSGDWDRVLRGLHYLAERKDPIAREEAVKLLDSKEPYTWFNAALYLGALDDEVAVPYLIKGLLHRATRAYDRTAAALSRITGEDYYHFQDWHAWWMKQHPDSDFDFDHHLGN